MRPRPSGLGYFLGGVVILVSVCAAIVLFVLGWRSTLEGLARVPVPGQGIVELDEGEQVIYVEPNAGGAPPQVPVRVLVFPESFGAPLQVYAYEGSFSYGEGEGSGYAYATFETPGAGRYPVETASGGQQSADSVAIGPSFGRAFLPWLFGGLAALFGGGLIGLTVIIVTAILRYTRRPDRARPAEAGTPTAQGGYAPASPAGPGRADAAEPALAGGPPAGWYVDPSGAASRRYWDGSRWTEHTSG